MKFQKWGNGFLNEEKVDIKKYYNDKNFEILNTLYDSRSREFQSKYIRINGEPDEVELVEKLEQGFIDFIEKNIQDKKMQRAIINKFEEIQDNNLAEMILWEKEYYKLGFLDGMNLNEELKNFIN